MIENGLSDFHRFTIKIMKKTSPAEIKSIKVAKCSCTTGCRGCRCECSKNNFQSWENRRKESFVVGDGEDEKENECDV